MFGQNIGIARNVYDSSDALDVLITNKVMMECYRSEKNFSNETFFAQMTGIVIEDFVALLKKDFGLKIYTQQAFDSIFDPNISSISLAGDKMFVKLMGKHSSDNLLREVKGDNHSKPVETNRWTVMYGGTASGCHNLKELFKKYFLKVNSEFKGIYCMTNIGNGLSLTHVGYPGRALIDTNYSKVSIEGFGRIVSDIISKTPVGCLSIISGPPGTGKTFMVRGIIDAAEKEALFVMIPPEVVASLSGPNMIPMLMEIKESYLGKKTGVVFIIEDADSILVPRGVDNMSSITTLLNITDGILGSLFDIKVLATTNASSLDFDTALTRPGRLSCRLVVEELNKDEAIGAYDALTNSQKGIEVVKGSMTLAEVYALAFGNDYIFEDKKEKLGF
ncbi:MAG: AAA family ATPase [Patescibacteria group bacterium]